MSLQYDNEFVQCVITIDAEAKVQIAGRIRGMKALRLAILSAPNPIDRMANYSGSGLPFPCAQIAFENTPNVAKITDPRGEFDVVFSYPNSYYTLDAHTRIEPSIFITLFWKDDNIEKTLVRLPLPDRIPLRTLNYRPNHALGPHYYAVKSDIVGIRGAEATMLAIADAKAMHDVA